MSFYIDIPDPEDFEHELGILIATMSVNGMDTDVIKRVLQEAIAELDSED